MRDENILINELDKSKSNSVQIHLPNGNELKDPNAPALQKLIIDSHEPEYIIETFKQEKGIYVEIKELTAPVMDENGKEVSRIQVGDYAFSNILIERKTLKDFYGSICHGDKRIWQQMFHLKRCAERPILVIERWDDSFLVELGKQRTVLSVMARIVMMGISVVVLPGSERDWRPFIDFVSYMFFASDKKEPSMKPLPAKGHQATVLDVREDMVCMSPMIGRKKAKEILSKYETIEDLCNADEADILKRLGPKTGRMLLDVLKKRFGNGNDQKQRSPEIQGHSN